MTEPTEARDVGKVTGRSLEAARVFLEVVKEQGDDVNDVLIEISAERSWQQGLKFGVELEGIDKRGEERFLQWVALGKAVEGVRNYFRGRAGMGIKMTVEPKRNQLVRPLVERIYEVARDEYGAKDF